MAKRRKSARRWPVMRLVLQPNGYRLELRYAERQYYPTIVGKPVFDSFGEALGRAIAVSGILGAELTVAATAVAQYLVDSPAFADEISQITIVESSEP